MAPLALGTDTGGSIRQPAAFCGVVGLKPTYGRVSRYGLVAFASSLDQVGPLGPHRRGRRPARQRPLRPRPERRHQRLASAVPDFVAASCRRRAGPPRRRALDLPGEGVEDGVLAAFRESLAALEARGRAIVEVSLPHAPHAIATYYIVATAEASSNLARFDGVRYGLRAPDGPTSRRCTATPATRASGPR